jgi:glycosyltransferase involved in cell wall biosynthesis
MAGEGAFLVSGDANAREELMKPDARPVSVIHHIGAFFPRPTGATYSAIRLVTKLREKGVASSFVIDARDNTWQKGGEYLHTYVRSFNLMNQSKLANVLGTLRLLLYLYRRRHDFDVFHIHGGTYMTLRLGRLVQILLGKVCMMKTTLNCWDTPDAFPNTVRGRFARHCYLRLNGVVSMTTGQMQKCLASGFRGHTAVIPNGVDCDLFRPAASDEKHALRTELGLPVDKFVILYTGWLGPRKGTDILFKVWSLLRKSPGQVALVCAGNYHTKEAMAQFLGDLKSFLKKYALDPTLVDSPDFIRIGHTEDLAKYYRASDLFLFPSRQEGFGTVQIEAMACGLPCVVNDIEGVTCDIYPDATTGYRIRNNNVDDFVAVCKSLMNNSEERRQIGITARERVLEHFALDVVANKYLSFYKELLS